LTDVKLWSTATCKLGWEVAGVFHQGMDGTDINTVDCNKERTLVASGDDEGGVCVYNFPILRNT